MHHYLPRRRLSVTTTTDSSQRHTTSDSNTDGSTEPEVSCFPSMLSMIRDDDYQALSSPFEDDSHEKLFHYNEPSKATMFEALSNYRERRMSLTNMMQPCSTCGKLLCDCLPSMSHDTLHTQSVPTTSLHTSLRSGRRRGSVILEQIQLNERVPIDTPIMLQHVNTGMYLQATIDNIAIPPSVVRYVILSC